MVVALGSIGGQKAPLAVNQDGFAGRYKEAGKTCCPR